MSKIEVLCDIIIFYLIFTKEIFSTWKECQRMSLVSYAVNVSKINKISIVCVNYLLFNKRCKRVRAKIRWNILSRDMNGRGNWIFIKNHIFSRINLSTKDTIESSRFSWKASVSGVGSTHGLSNSWDVANRWPNYRTLVKSPWDPPRIMCIMWTPHVTSIDLEMGTRELRRYFGWHKHFKIFILLLYIKNILILWFIIVSLYIILYLKEIY